MFKLTCIEARSLLLSYNSWSPSVEIQFSPWNGGLTLADFVFTWCCESGFCLSAQVHAHCTVTPPPGGAGNLCQKVCTRLNVSFLVMCLLLTLFSYRIPLVPLVFNYNLAWSTRLNFSIPWQLYSLCNLLRHLINATRHLNTDNWQCCLDMNYSSFKR